MVEPAPLSVNEILQRSRRDVARYRKECESIVAKSAEVLTRAGAILSAGHACSIGQSPISPKAIPEIGLRVRVEPKVPNASESASLVPFILVRKHLPVRWVMSGGGARLPRGNRVLRVNLWGREFFIAGEDIGENDALGILGVARWLLEARSVSRGAFWFKEVNFSTHGFGRWQEIPSDRGWFFRDFQSPLSPL